MSSSSSVIWFHIKIIKSIHIKVFFLISFLTKDLRPIWFFNNTSVTFATPKSWHFSGPYFQFLPPANLPTHPPGKVRIQDKSRSGCIGQGWESGRDMMKFWYIRIFIRYTWKISNIFGHSFDKFTRSEYIRVFIRQSWLLPNIFGHSFEEEKKTFVTLWPIARNIWRSGLHTSLFFSQLRNKTLLDVQRGEIQESGRNMFRFGNTPGIRGWSRLRNRTLAVKTRKNSRKSSFVTKTF